ncbi:MAG: hypothetical protein D6772_12440 [Bacteroidetes bacterium]|nr:MAG: hypothetical protein D6772_12440 [Bacteroidota bacterium]
MRVLFLLSACCLVFPAFTQVCNGSLGDNIFQGGDFGRGVANIRLPDPRIAPDYTYAATNPPPEDGSYVLTNSTEAWPGLFPTWLPIGDNSDDPQGYMMVVNASFTPGLFYDQEVTDLCDNTLYEFSVDIINLIRPGVGGHIQPNVSFLLDGMLAFSTGNIPASGAWQTYGFTFTTEPGQSSVRLSLRNDAPGGIGNDLALDNISFRPCGDQALILPPDTAVICEDGAPFPLYATVDGDEFIRSSIQWQRSPDGISGWENIPAARDSVYLHTDFRLGSYYYRFQIAGSEVNLSNPKCRINSNVKVLRVQAREYYRSDTICAGLSVSIGESIYTETGIYTDSLLSVYGCDSIVILDLLVLEDPDLRPSFNLRPPNCFDTNEGEIEIASIRNGIPPYIIQFEDQPLGLNRRFVGLPGDSTYRIQITDATGCMLDTMVFLAAPVPLTLDLGPDQNLLLGESLSLRARTNFAAASYRWTTTVAEQAIPCFQPQGCQEVNWLPLADQYVYLTAEDELGCTITDSAFIAVATPRDVYIPNVFSPNDDGLNDHFMAFGPTPRISSITRLQVLDRWGKLIFDGRELTPGVLREGWDGTVQGKPASIGVYIYQLEVRFLDGFTQTYSGDIMLVR